MKIVDGAQQFELKDLKAAGRPLKHGPNYLTADEAKGLVAVTVDDLNLFLRTHVRKKGLVCQKIRKNSRGKSNAQSARGKSRQTRTKSQTVTARRSTGT